MNSITSLSDWKIDGLFLKKTDTKDGVINNVTMSGRSYNIASYIDYYYDLKVKFLTEAEAKKIRTDLINLLKNNRTLDFTTQFLKSWGFVSFSEKNTTSLIFEPSKIDFKPSEIFGLYDFTLECYERVRV
ncbi:MAG: hypothetical protein ACRCZ2_06860 [Fusobacteriaceae bacterium]